MSNDTLGWMAVVLFVLGGIGWWRASKAIEADSRIRFFVWLGVGMCCTSVAATPLAELIRRF